MDNKSSWVSQVLFDLFVQKPVLGRTQLEGELMRVTVKSVTKTVPEKVIDEVNKITEVGVCYMLEKFSGETIFLNRQKYNLFII